VRGIKEHLFLHVIENKLYCLGSFIPYLILSDNIGCSWVIYGVCLCLCSDVYKLNSMIFLHVIENKLYCLGSFIPYLILSDNIGCSWVIYGVCLCLCSDVYKLNSMIGSFQELLDNIYKPLFEVTIDPRMHPQLHMFLQYVSSYIFTSASFARVTVFTTICRITKLDC